MGISSKSIQKLMTIRDQLDRERERYETVWKDIAKYINPAMSDWEDLPPSLSKAEIDPQRDLYDTTALRASNLLADGIQGYAFGRSNAWHRMALEEQEMMENESVSEWMQLVERHNYKQLSKSSFYDEGRSFVKCGADFGTAVMMRYEDDTRGIPCYKTQHLKRCYLAENRYGEVDTLFRDVWLTPYDAAAWFGYDKLPKQIKVDYDQGKIQPFLFHEFIVPLEKYDLDISARESKGKPYYSVYVPACDIKKPVLEGGYSVKPFFAWRWTRSLDGEVWGADSPGYMEISNIKQLNMTRKDYLRMRQLSARPPIKATEGLRGRLKIEPNGVTYLRPGEDYAMNPMVARTDEIGADMEIMKRGINESFHADFFLILSQNIERMKTATEVAGLQGEKAAMLTAFFGRLSTEFLEPVIEDLFDSEFKAGRLPPVPQQLQGKELKVDMVSPLAQMQKRYLGMTSTQEAIQQIVMLAQVDQSVLDNIDFDNHVRVIAEEYNIDKRTVRDLVDVEKIRQARAQQQQAMMQAQMGLEQAKVEADAYNKMSKAPEAGSPAEAMSQQRRQG